MCTTTNIEEAREISYLLNLETYQGMTDEEIDLIINYKIKQALSQQECLIKANAENMRVEQCIADNQASAKQALDMLQSIIEREFTTLPVVQPRTFVPRSLES